MSRGIIYASIGDAGHFTPEQRAEIIASYPQHERDARTKGIPTLGSGRIFPVSEEMIAIDPLKTIPKYWPRIGGMDFGYTHPSAAVELAWDRDQDTVYVVRAFRAAQLTPVTFSAAVRPWGKDLLRGPGTAGARPWREPALRWRSSTRRKA